jgi:hypothetical protein
MHASVGKSKWIQGIVGTRKGTLVRLKDGGEVQFHCSDPKEVQREFDVLETDAGKLVAVYGPSNTKRPGTPPPSKAGVIAGHDEYFWIDLSGKQTKIVRIREF